MGAVVLLETHGAVATVTLARPECLNAIDSEMPAQLADAVATANADPRVKVIVLQGAGRAFCAGYDLKLFAERKGPASFHQAMPWDPLRDFQVMWKNTAEHFMTLWSSLKPIICKVHGVAIGGGTDIALCCDIVIAAEDAAIGYPPARVFGCPTTMMWVVRLGPERAKRLLLTGDVIDGREAARLGLVLRAVPRADLDAEVDRLARRMAEIPLNQLIMHKLVINSAVELSGLRITQTLATLMDGIARHSPEGVAFKRRCEAVGFKQAVRERDHPAGGAITFPSKL